MNSIFSGTFSRNSSASRIVVMSAPVATSTTPEKPRRFSPETIWAGVVFAPNWPTNDGASMATTFSFRFSARRIWTIILLSSRAPKGHALRQFPQPTHLL